jgi:LacI family transcriptional regulator
MVTIKDIAKLADVSVATVSYVLNNTRWVSEDKKERVLKAIAELNYVPNAVARGLRVRESRTISFVVSDITNPFYPDLAKACENIAQAKGYTVNVINTDDQADRMQQAITQILEGRVDGLVIASALDRDKAPLQKLMKQGYPLVLASRLVEGLDVDSVVADNFNGAIMATNHLLRLGHKRIALIPGVKGSSITVSRRSGYLKAMEEAGATVYPEWFVSGEAKYTVNYNLAQTLMKLPNHKRPTAIINLTDVGALGVMDAVRDMNMRIPEEFAVIGFDDLFFSATRSVQLTTIKIPRYEIGSLATKLLFERLGNKSSVDYQEIVLPVELIVRGTCGGKKTEG